MAEDPAPADTRANRPEKIARPRRWRRRLVECVLGLLLAPIAVWVAVRHLTGNQGLARVLDDEVAVHADYARGTTTIVSTPGYRPYLPWVQEVFRFDKSPNAFVMKGNVQQDENHVPRLLVRANDGSSFWFDELTLQYALMPDKADFVLEDSGPADAFKQKLVRAYARSILRDEFGRFSAEEAVKPENLRVATQKSLERLNLALNPHGIEVLEVSTPKPAFDQKYEEAIARRKVANQEVEHLKAELGQLAQVKIQREQAVRNDKEIEMRRLEGNLAADLSAAQTELIRARAEADLV
jgi:membrane protease subunit HflC